MKNLPCNVIRDLLVLYEDNVCSTESRELIKEHIETCEECRRIYEDTQKTLPDIALGDTKKLEKTQDEMFLKSIEKYTRAITYKHLIILGIFILVFSVGVGLYQTHFREFLFSVPASDIQVKELYQLNDGSIYCTLQTPKAYGATVSKKIQVPESKNFKNCDKGWHELHFQYPKPSEKGILSLNRISYVFPMEEYGTSPHGERPPYHYTAASIKYYGKSKNDVVTIWKKGQKLSPAPMEIEKKAIVEYVNRGELEKALEQCKQLGISLEDLDIDDDILARAYEDYYNTLANNIIAGGEVDKRESFPYQISSEYE